MPKPKVHNEEEGTAEAPSFEDFESDDFHEDHEVKSVPRDSRQPKQPARQRLELRSEQHALRQQLSDWDDYGQDDFDTKL
jgi:hypothetical protein